MQLNPEGITLVTFVPDVATLSHVILAQATVPEVMLAV
jgi:hypothetical protein